MINGKSAPHPMSIATCLIRNDSLILTNRTPTSQIHVVFTLRDRQPWLNTPPHCPVFPEFCLALTALANCTTLGRRFIPYLCAAQVFPLGLAIRRLIDPTPPNFSQLSSADLTFRAGGKHTRKTLLVPRFWARSGYLVGYSFTRRGRSWHG